MLATGNNVIIGYRLSIRFCADGFSFSVENMLDGSTVQTDYFPIGSSSDAATVLRQALRKPYLMDYRFRVVDFVADVPSTIVPLEHFRKSDMVPFYRLCFPNQQIGVADMQYQILSSLEAVMLFRLSQDVLRAVQECYPDVKVSCADGRMLERIAAHRDKQTVPTEATQQVAYVNVEDNRLFVAVFDRTSLRYAGSQSAGNDNDRIFLLLGIWKSLGMHATRDVCHLQGASEALKASLGEYLLNVD